MMRIITLICLVLCMSCKSEPKSETTQVLDVEVKEFQNDAERIASAHGIDNWKYINRIDFTFAVSRGENQAPGRAWTWFPKLDSVYLRTDEEVIKYSRKNIDSSALKADPGFINDKFWLLAPFQLVWDEGAILSEPEMATAPISNIDMNKITITYGEEGGYTPGDAYDFYYNSEYVVQEWVYRRGNSETPTLATTFENYKVVNGMMIAQDHKTADGNLNIRCINISAE